MVRFRSVAAGIVVASVLATGLAFAQGPRSGGPGGRGGRGAMGPGGPGLALGVRDLSDAQREQVRAIRQRAQEQGQEVQTRLADLRDTQRAAIERLPVDEALITSATQDLVQAQVEVALQEARLNAEIWAVLTPEQQERVTTARAERAARVAHRESRMAERRQAQQRRSRQ